MSMYLHSGRGLKLPNLDLMGKVAAVQEQHQRYVIAAGDWQNKPAALASTGLLYRGKLEIVAPTRPTCIMKKSSTTIDYFVVSKAIAPRFAEATVQVTGLIATHRPVLSTVQCQSQHFEKKVKMQKKIPPAPTSPVGPYNHRAKWNRAKQALQAACEAAIAATRAKVGKDTKTAVKHAHHLHDKAYRSFVDTAEIELSSVFDVPLSTWGQRANNIQVVDVLSKPVQPQQQIRLRSGIEPYRQLLQRGHLYYQHLLQTISNKPKDIDNRSIEYFAKDFAEEEVPDCVSLDKVALQLWQQLLTQVQSVVADKTMNALIDSRPLAFHSFRKWEDKLSVNISNVENHDKKNSEP